MDPVIQVEFDFNRMRKNFIIFFSFSIRQNLTTRGPSPEALRTASLNRLAPKKKRNQLVEIVFQINNGISLDPANSLPSTAVSSELNKSSKGKQQAYRGTGTGAPARPFSAWEV